MSFPAPLRIRQRAGAVIALAIAIVISACSNDATSITDIGIDETSRAGAPSVRSYRIQIVEGDNQATRPNSQVPEEVVVRVVDSQGRGISGAQVFWRRFHSAGAIRHSETRTDSQGFSSNRWTLGPDFGKQYLQARTAGNRRVMFVATGANVPVEEESGDDGSNDDGSNDSSKNIRITEGNNQSGAAGELLANRPRVRVVDAEGRGVSNIQVLWEVRTGGGSVGWNSNRTNSQGVASNTWTLGEESRDQTMRARLDNGGSVTFRATSTTFEEDPSTGEPPTEDPNTEDPPTGGGTQTLFVEDFEGSLSSAIFTGNLCCSSNSFAMENGVSRTGNRSARMRLRRSDPMVNDGKRSELSMSNRNDFSGGAGAERWFGVSLRPEAGWRIDPDLTVVTWQVAAVPDAGERWRPPVLQIDITGNRWNFKVSADANRITDRTYSRKTVWSDNVDFGDWTDFVVHVRYEYDNSGLLELWKDGQKVLTYRGPTAYNDSGMNYFNKMGLYIFDWNYSSGTEAYTLHMDSWKISDQNGGYSAVAPRR